MLHQFDVVPKLLQLPHALLPLTGTLSAASSAIEWVSDPALPQYINDTCSFVQDHQNYMFYGWPDLELFQWF
jgi:hypothetical protein